MNIRAECRNQQCPNYRLEKSVVVGELLGYGAPNGRIACPKCGELMSTTETENVSTRRKDTSRTRRRRAANRSSKRR